MRVSLATPRRGGATAFTSRPQQGPNGWAFLEAEADVILGGADPLQVLPFATTLESEPSPSLGDSSIQGEPPMNVALVEPSPTSLFGPRGAHLFGEDGPLFVSDTGHHRVLGWHKRPTADGVPADIVLGQPNFAAEGRNAGGTASAKTMNVPTGIGPFGTDGMFVCDGWNSRVLIWHRVPTESHTPADLVLGQADFAGELPNRGGISDASDLDTMHWPFQALCVDDRFVVADTGNRRLLIWESLPSRSGQPADRVLGQPDGRSRHDNGGGEPSACSFRWPHDVALLGTDLVVTDAGNNRILVWSGVPADNLTPARLVLGQPDMRSVDHNQGHYWPTESALNMPYAVATQNEWLIAADTASSRLVGWRDPSVDGEAALALAAQAHFYAKGDNRWGAITRDSVCWPYGLQLIGRTALICDTGNHRVLLWPTRLLEYTQNA